MHKISEKKYVCLPYIKLSELLSETHWPKQTLFEGKIVFKKNTHDSYFADNLC